MTNNDVLRRLRYTFNFNHEKIISIFSSGESLVTRDEISNWLKKDDDENFVYCPDVSFAAFLNGFINERRGKREGVTLIPEQKLNNNIVLTKLKIAFNFTSEDIIALLAEVDFHFSKSELSALFRHVEHKNYRVCKDQLLRKILQGINKKYYVKRQSKGTDKKHSASETNDKADNLKNKKYKSARVKASNIYINPKAKKDENTPSSRKVLKLKPKDIWGE